MVIVDVFTDPDNPEFVAAGPSMYAHDVFVRDNLMYSSEIYQGRAAIYDVSDKENISLLGSQNTPASFTHNIWLSDNSQVMFTTDEVGNAPVTAYDISDMDNIEELDQYRPIATLGEGVLPHNVHVWQDWLIISYYADGGIIVDASRPDNLIEVGNFDTFFGEAGFGAWGAYPFLPSGIVLVTDTGNGLFILDANYVRACWLEGLITDASTGFPINGADVEILSSQPNAASSDASGNYAGGQAIPGTFEVVYSANGYFPQTIEVELINGEVTIQDVALIPESQVILFEADNTDGCQPLTVNFTDQSPIEVVSWNWTFPGGVPENSTDENPSILYNQPGVFDVTLETTDADGNDYVLTLESYISIAPLATVDFEFDVEGATVTFLNLTTMADSYLWDFGDGNTSTEISPVHTYAESGEFTITLEAFNDCGSNNLTTSVVVMVVGINEPVYSYHMQANPNPFSSQINVSYQSLEAFDQAVLRIFNPLGQIVETRKVDGLSGSMTLGNDWEPGLYFLKLQELNGKAMSRTMRVIKH